MAAPMPEPACSIPMILPRIKALGACYEKGSDDNISQKFKQLFTIFSVCQFVCIFFNGLIHNIYL